MLDYVGIGRLIKGRTTSYSFYVALISHGERDFAIYICNGETETLISNSSLGLYKDAQ